MTRTRGKKRGRPVRPEAQAGRIALLAAAREVLAEKGMAGMTLREAAARAGVDPALAQYYFGSKAGLQAELIRQLTQGLRARIEEIASGEGTLEERLEGLMRAYAEALASDPDAARLALEQALFPKRDDTGWFAADYVRPAIAAVRPLLEEAMAQGEIRPSNPFFLFASFAGACLFFSVAGPTLGRVFGVEEITPDTQRAFADYLSQLFRRGLAQAADSREGDV